MELVFSSVTAVAAVVAAAALVALAIEFHELRRSTEKVGLRMRVACEPGDHYCCHGVGNIDGGFAIHTWQQDRWILHEDRSSPGYEPSPPTKPGSYDTHKLRTPSVPRRTI